MCLIAFAWKAHPDYTLVLGANRDEWHDRPAAPAAWWQDQPHILAGRDLKGGGTWLGVTRSGRLAALTNFRDPSDRKSDAPTRGRLVSEFLCGDLGPREYLLDLRERASMYQGFNLLLGDGRSLYYYGSRIGEILAVPPGVHALSNHTLDEPWPKVDMATNALEAALGTASPEGALRLALFDLLSNDVIAPDGALPDTGVGQAWERVLSPALIVTENYGTRCSSVLTIDRRGNVTFEERTRDRGGTVTSAFRERFLAA